MERECPMSVYECDVCGYKMERRNIQAKHESYRCIYNLKIRLKDLERENQEFKRIQEIADVKSRAASQDLVNQQ